ncbi:hypothetical protein [Aquabacterium lacunae]|nr:hypothetical protein [Aquabacterium lacunae]
MDLLSVVGLAVPTTGALLALLFRTEARITRLETIIEGMRHA